MIPDAFILPLYLFFRNLVSENDLNNFLIASS